MRRVITKRDVSASARSIGGGKAVQAAGFAPRRVKYIPAETITALGVLQAANYFGSYSIDVAIAAALNFLYLGVLHRAGIWQVIVSYLAFSVWVLILDSGQNLSFVYENGAAIAGLADADAFRKALLPVLVLVVTLIGPVIDEVGDRFAVNR